MKTNWALLSNENRMGRDLKHQVKNAETNSMMFFWGWFQQLYYALCRCLLAARN